MNSFTGVITVTNYWFGSVFDKTASPATYVPQYLHSLREKCRDLGAF